MKLDQIVHLFSNYFLELMKSRQFLEFLSFQFITVTVRPEKFQFLEKGQNRNFGYEIVISVKNPKFILWISDDKTDCAVGIVSQNLASTLNFVEFRDNRNLHVFRGIVFRVP